MGIYIYITYIFIQNLGPGGRFLQLYLTRQQTRSSHTYIYIYCVLPLFSIRMSCGLVVFTDVADRMDVPLKRRNNM